MSGAHCRILPTFSAACAYMCPLATLPYGFLILGDVRFKDMDAPVADVLRDGGRQCIAHVLIAYRYPSAELGPKSADCEEVVVSHRCARSPCRHNIEQLCLSW